MSRVATVNIFESEVPLAEMAAQTDPKTEQFHAMLKNAGFSLPPSLGGKVPNNIDRQNGAVGDTPLLDDLITKTGSLIGGAVEGAGNAFGSAMDGATDFGLAAGMTAAATLTLLGDAFVREDKERENKIRFAFDADGNGIDDIAQLNAQKAVNEAGLPLAAIFEMHKETVIELDPFAAYHGLGGVGGEHSRGPAEGRFA